MKFAQREESQADYLAFQWSEDTLPGCRRYLAEIAEVPVGMASFPVFDGVGFFGTAGTVPEFRGRGVQMALLKRRLADAPDLGCDLVIGGSSLFSPPHRNFERAGLRLVPMGTGWRDGCL
jgi:GNAT superfamily N-acetyltransferase